MSFEWQTEEDEWRDPPPVAPEPEPNENSRWGWVGLVGFVVLALSISGIYLYRQATNRVAEVEALLEEDVLASHRLVRQAAAEADYEIFVQVLSGRDPDWVADQRLLLLGGQLYDRRGLGMVHLQPTAEPEIEQIAFSPDLTSATMQTNEVYAINVGNGLSDTVVFSHTAVYRLGPDNWLYSPPLEDRWGEWMTHEGRYLTLIFPESEAEIAGRLAFDLENKLAELCGGVQGMNCPADFHQQVRLVKEPESLLIQADIRTLSALSSADEIELPAPRLVGMPVDEAGYRALMRGYAYYVVGGAFMEFVDYTCCGQQAFMAALVEQLLADLALRPRPLFQETYTDLLQSGVDIADPFISWNNNAEHLAAADLQQGAAVIAFLRHATPEVSLLQMADGIDQALSYWSWLRDLTPGLVSDAEIRQTWLDFLVTRSAINNRELPYDLPEQNVLALCGLNTRSITGALYQFGVADGSWQPVAEEMAFTNLFPTGEGDSVALVYTDNRVLTEPEVALYSWEDGRPVLRWQPGEDAELLYLYSVPEASGQNLLISLRTIGAGDSGLYAFNTAECTAGTCQPQVFAGIPVYAPGEEHVLVMLPISPSGPEPFIYLATSDGERLFDLGSGESPFWIDSRTFGFVRTGETGELEIVVGAIDGEELETLVGLAGLIAAIPPDQLPLQPNNDEGDGTAPRFFIDEVVANPVRPDQLFITLDLDNQLSNQILTLDRASGRVTWRLSAGGASNNLDLGFSPDGSWLLVEEFNQAANQGRVILHHIDTGQEEFYSLSDFYYGLSWTADSRWLAKVDGDWLVLIAPGMDYQQITIHDLPSCGPAGWVSR